MKSYLILIFSLISLNIFSEEKDSNINFLCKGKIHENFLTKGYSSFNGVKSLVINTDEMTLELDDYNSVKYREGHVEMFVKLLDVPDIDGEGPKIYSISFNTITGEMDLWKQKGDLTYNSLGMIVEGLTMEEVWRYKCEKTKTLIN